MKKFTKILCMALASIMVLATVFTAAACPKGITVKFMADGNQFQSVKVDKGAAVAEPEEKPKKEGYVFSHWVEDQNNPSMFYYFGKAVTSNLTLHAYFAPVNPQTETFEVTFNYVGGTSVTMVLEKGLTLYEPYMPREEFIGWFTKDDIQFKDFDKPVDADIFLTAKYTEGKGGTLVMNSGDFDGVFSPFFSSSAYDGAVAGQTQIGMLSSDYLARVKVGDDVPTVAKDYKTTTYVRGVIDTDGSKGAALTDTERKNGNIYWTEYEFLIKNGIKFSDGKDLTIKDVLFNMYVNLDPVYDGSATMYSTAIKGLKAYRAQQPIDDNGDMSNWQATHNRYAEVKRDDIYRYFLYDTTLQNNGESQRNSYRNNTYKSTVKEKTIIDDVQFVRDEFWKEIVTDYKSAAATPFGTPTKERPFGDTNPYSDEMFTQVWEVFLYMNGFITVDRGPDGLIVEENDSTVTDKKLDPRDGKYKKIKYNGCENFSKDPLDLMKIAYNAMMGIEESGTSSELDGIPIDLHISDEKYKEARKNLTAADKEKNDYSKLNSLITVNDLKVTGNEHKIYETSKDDFDNVIIDPLCLNNTNYLVGRLRSAMFGEKVLKNIKNILRYWATGQNVNTSWVNDSITAEVEKNKVGGRFAVQTVSGITVDSVTSFNGVNGVDLKGESHYVLKIEIVGVDPKAIWNFGFTVAPMEYYSDPTGKNSGFTLSEDGYQNFNYKGTPGYDESKPIKLGFKQHDKNYFAKVFKDENVIRLPKGAGAYMATNSSNESNNPTYSEFLENNIVYFKANDQFQTTGTRVTNPRIQKLRYQVIDTSKVMETLVGGDINYGDPQAKEQNINTVKRNNHLAGDLIDNLGYGYVGINAKYVQNINVRKIIMTAMNTKMILDYYTGNLAQVITRPMSTNSWAYPDGELDAYPFVSEANVVSKINSNMALIDNTRKDSNGKWEILEDGQWKKLKYTFTIAGAETDHPAYAMFLEAARILNKNGFIINVLPDPLALSKLAGGTLHVWAAAWGSGIDPDMYQTYHKDSTASSVRAWGYPYMKDNKDRFGTELGIIETLSKYIDDGRATMDQAKRKSIYKNALNEVMKLAIEYPTYQRKNYVVYNKNDFDTTTFFRPLTAYAGHLNRLWEVQMLNE